MRTIKCSFWVNVPQSATKDEITAWLKYELGQLHSLSMENPLSDTDIEAQNVMVEMFS